jgi:heat-inducible transcriptional repressor
MAPLLSQRSESVLKSLIEAYLVEGEPVGSRLLSKRFQEGISSATIRNVLADLEDEGLVDQPHTSAGRVPTERAYRSTTWTAG